MRRMTISRSKRAAWAALLALPFLGVSLSAQDTTHASPAAQDTSHAVKTDTAASQSPLQQTVPGTHTVAKGETLWSIARLYYNDPLLWPEIYRLNTNVVEDPHWIYPGQVLAITTGDTTTMVAQTDTAKTVPQAAPPTDTTVAQAAPPVDTVRADTTAKMDTTTRVAAAPVDTTPKPDTLAVAAPPAADTTTAPPPPSEPVQSYETVFDHPITPTQQVENQLHAYLHQAYHAVRPGEYYSAGWLTEGEKLPWATVLGNTETPAIHRLSSRTTAGQYEEIAIEPPGGASYHVGDSLLVARRDRPVSGWGDVVVPLGMARVTTVQSSQVLASIIHQYGRITDGNLALPLEPFRNPGEVRPAPVTQGLEGAIIAPQVAEPLAGTQTIYFIDKGRAEGVVPGDIFEAYRPSTGQVGGASEQMLVQFLIVHTREHSASGLVIGISSPDIKAGTKVRLIRKMPS